MIQKPGKPKICPCGIKFTPRGIQKYHSPKCEMDHKTGKVTTDQLGRLSTSVLFQLAKGAFQKWIKKRDAGKPCVSCGKALSKNEVIHASHVFKCELYSWLIFDEDNCHSGCDYCNIGLDGNHKNYVKNLVGRIGIDRTTNLIDKASLKIYTKYGSGELIEIIKKYSD
jgi:hypothetical protein